MSSPNQRNSFPKSARIRPLQMRFKISSLEKAAVPISDYTTNNQQKREQKISYAHHAYQNLALPEKRKFPFHFIANRAKFASSHRPENFEPICLTEGDANKPSYVAVGDHPYGTRGKSSIDMLQLIFGEDRQKKRQHYQQITTIQKPVRIAIDSSSKRYDDQIYVADFQSKIATERNLQPVKHIKSFQIPSSVKRIMEKENLQYEEKTSRSKFPIQSRRKHYLLPIVETILPRLVTAQHKRISRQSLYTDNRGLMSQENTKNNLSVNQQLVGYQPLANRSSFDNHASFSTSCSRQGVILSNQQKSRQKSQRDNQELKLKSQEFFQEQEQKSINNNLSLQSVQVETKNQTKHPCDDNNQQKNGGGGEEEEGGGEEKSLSNINEPSEAGSLTPEKRAFVNLRHYYDLKYERHKPYDHIKNSIYRENIFSSMPPSALPSQRNTLEACTANCQNISQKRYELRHFLHKQEKNTQAAKEIEPWIPYQANDEQLLSDII